MPKVQDRNNDPVPITAADLDEYIPREFIELVGHPKVGKSYTVMTIARTWKRLHPDNKIYILDTENGLIKTWKQSFSECKNIELYPCRDMNHFLENFAHVISKHKPGDWIVCESISRIWEMAQDLGYEAVVGLSKADYMQVRKTTMAREDDKGKKKSGPITPQPDQLWQIVKNAYNANFINILVNHVDCNILLTTTLGKERPKEYKESAARKEAREMLGLNVSPDGDPRNPYYPDTIILMTKDQTGFHATVLGDRGHEVIGHNRHFDIDDFWLDFIDNCRSEDGD